jgi:hypothetical protein
LSKHSSRLILQHPASKLAQLNKTNNPTGFPVGLFVLWAILDYSPAERDPDWVILTIISLTFWHSENIEIALYEIPHFSQISDA